MAASLRRFLRPLCRLSHPRIQQSVKILNIFLIVHAAAAGHISIRSLSPSYEGIVVFLVILIVVLFIIAVVLVAVQIVLIIVLVVNAILKVIVLVVLKTFIKSVSSA